MWTQWAHQSIADICEQDLVARLVRDPHWRERITNIHGMPENPNVYTEEPLEGIAESVSGDVDLLLVEKSAPENATAIQIKRIKVGENAFHTGKPNKLSDIEKGVRQANLLDSVGFFQVYLYLFIVVDSRVRNIGEYSYKGLTPELQSTLRAEINVSRLHSNIGMIEFEFTQPMDSAPLGVGAYGGSLKRLATPRSQASDVTAWVKGVIERNG